MKRSLITILLILTFFVLTASILFGDERSEPKDLIVALDKSLSMEDKINEVKNFLLADIIDGLIKDDFFLLLVFYGNTEVAAAKYISDPVRDIPILKAEVSRVLADGPFTDIGRVLDRLKEEFFERAENGRKKWCFLVTDGIHEPTLNSKYFSTDGTFDHEFLDDLKEIKNANGWKVQFLEIGEGSAREMAETLGVEYVQVEEDVTAEEISSTIDNPYVTITISPDSISPVVINQKRKGTLSFNLETDGMQQEIEIVISGLLLQSSALTLNSFLDSDSPFSLTLPAEDTLTEVIIPVKVESELAPGDYEADVFFTFLSSEHFDDDNIKIRIHVNNFFQNHWWALPLLILGIIIVLAGLTLLMIKLFQGKGFSFKVIILESPIPENQNHFTVKKKKELYMNESLDVISFGPKKSRKSVARITYIPGGIHLKPLNEFRFEKSENLPENIINETIELRTLSNKLLKITFKSVT